MGEFLAKNAKKAVFAEMEMRKTKNVQSNRWNKFEKAPWLKEDENRNIISDTWLTIINSLCYNNINLFRICELRTKMNFS